MNDAHDLRPGYSAEGVGPRPNLKRWLPLLAGSVALGVYLATLAPTVTSEDSGEFIGAAYFWGVAHPPGYPSWTMLCGVFLRLVPLGNIAWRCNFFSAVCAALAIGVFCQILILIGLRPLAAAAGAMLCGFGRVLWSQSVITEVYTLHFLIFSLIIWCALRFDRGQSHSTGRLVLASFLLGLGMSNHQTIGYIGVAVAAWLLLRHPYLIRRWKVVLTSTAAFLLGLLPYMYIPIRANADPPINWGNAQTAFATWDHVSRRQYRTADDRDSLDQARTWSQHRLGQLRLISRYCGGEYTHAMLIAAVPGLLIMLKRRFRWFLLLWLLLVACSVVIHIIATDFAFDDRVNQWCNQVFFIPLYACIAIAVAFTLHGILEILDCFPSPLKWAITVGLVLAVPAVPLAANYPINNMRNYYYAEDHARNLLDCMLPHAIIFPSGDHNTFPLLYLVLVEKHRPDVIIADKYGYIDLDLYEDMPDNPGKPRTLTDRNRIEEWVIRHAKRPVYYTVNRSSLIANARMVQSGILYHLLPEGKTFESDAPWAKVRYRNLSGLAAPRDFGADNILADYEFFQGSRDLNHNRRAQALDHFAQCTTYAAGVKEIFNNIGSALADFNCEEDAIRYYQSAAALDPRYTPPRWNLARLHKSRAEFSQAEQAFIELSRADPNDFRVWGELGFLAARAGRDEDAVALWRKSLGLNPNQPQIIEQLYHYHFQVVPSTGPASQPATMTAPSATS